MNNQLRTPSQTWVSASLAPVERDLLVAYTFAGGIEYGIGNGRTHSGNADLADTTPARRRVWNRPRRPTSRRFPERRGELERDTPPSTLS